MNAQQQHRRNVNAGMDHVFTRAAPTADEAHAMAVEINRLRMRVKKYQQVLRSQMCSDCKIRDTEVCNGDERYACRDARAALRWRPHY